MDFLLWFHGLSWQRRPEYLANLPDQLEYLELGENLRNGRGLVFYSETFQDEFRGYLREYRIEWDERYVWD